MIPRYSRPEMARVWSDEERFARWWDVEVAACKAWAEEGSVPREALPALKRARFDPSRVEEHARITHHEMTGFLRAISESVGPEARFVHLGLTSSDVRDTALALQLLAAVDLLGEDLDALHDV
ncbi:MAG: adenylosuccinate lyase, partial [Chloroflexi bacterium]|nr:adenylosuccinate lyase [Chloroflexota bacterium]